MGIAISLLCSLTQGQQQQFYLGALPPPPDCQPNEILSEDWTTCIACPFGYIGMINTCQEIVCNPDEDLSFDGLSCVLKTPSDDCYYGYMPGPDGECYKIPMATMCSLGEAFDHTEKRCKKHACNERQKVLPDFSCEYCPQFMA